MPQWNRLITLVTVVQVLIVCKRCDSTAKRPSGGNADYSDYEYEADYHETYNRNQQQQSMDYGGDIIDVKATETTPLMCYSCELTLLEDGHIEGFPNCNEPFSSFDIAQVQCTGACSKKYELKNKNSYTIRRSCLPNCRERTIQDKEYVKCCTTKLCNGSTTWRTIKNNRRYLLLTVSASVMSVLVARL